MNDNVKMAEGPDNFKAQRGIGLYKINYEMDVKDSVREQSYIAGIIAYSSKEAVDTLIEFARKNVKGFKGMKINEVSHDGACHAMSEVVRNAVIKTAIKEGLVMKLEDDKQDKENKKESKKAAKKSIVPKDK